MRDQDEKWPVFEQDELDAVSDVLRSGRVNYWTGTRGREFEERFAEYCGARYGVALANGTVALELALRTLGVSAGDDVIVSARSFFASASVIVACGARPVFADVDETSQNVTVDTIDAAVTPRTRAVIAVHLAGWPCDMPAIGEYCRLREISVIEDCAQAHGAAIEGQRVGSFGDTAAFSFCQDKIISTGGEGGMLITDNERLWKAAWSYKDHGKSWDEVQRADHTVGFRWLHESFGTNWRLTEMQSALGLLQLRKLEAMLQQRHRNADLLLQVLESTPAVRLARPPSDVRHAWYRFYCFVESDRLKKAWTRDRVVAEVNSRGVPCFVGSCPEIYMEQAFDRSNSRPAARLPVCQRLGETSLALLVDPSQSPQRMVQAGETLKSVLEEATR